jgi:hypothetical protein
MVKLMIESPVSEVHFLVTSLVIKKQIFLSPCKVTMPRGGGGRSGGFGGGTYLEAQYTQPGPTGNQPGNPDNYTILKTMNPLGSVKEYFDHAVQHIHCINPRSVVISLLLLSIIILIALICVCRK